MNKLYIGTIVLMFMQSLHFQASSNNSTKKERSITYITSSQGITKHDSKDGKSEITFRDGTVSGQQAFSLGVAAMLNDLDQFPHLNSPEVRALLEQFDNECEVFFQQK